MCVDVASGRTGEFKVSSSKSDVGTYGQNDTVADSPRVTRLRETISLLWNYPSVVDDERKLGGR